MFARSATMKGNAKSSLHNTVILSPDMKKTIPTKAEIALLKPFIGLPLECIHIPATNAQFASATAEIKAARIVGFDTESKPTFVTGVVSDGPHIVQFAVQGKAFIFQLYQADCRQYLIELLQSDDVLKVGFGLKSDRGQIHTKLGVNLEAVLDLNSVFRKDGYRSDIGVRAAVGVVFNQKFHKSKKITTSNWALPQLTTNQLLYAANDAYAALMVLEALNLSQENLSTIGQNPRILASPHIPELLPAAKD